MRETILTTGILALLTVPVPGWTEEGSENIGEEVLVIEKKPEAVRIPSTFGSRRIRNWYVLDSSSLVVELSNREKYKAVLMNRCTGLRFADSIGFSTQGPWELDKWTTIYLPDGQRCYIKDLTPYADEPASTEKSD